MAPSLAKLDASGNNLSRKGLMLTNVSRRPWTIFQVKCLTSHLKLI